MIAAIITAFLVAFAEIGVTFTKGVLFTCGAFYAIKYLAPNFNIKITDAFGKVINIKFYE